MAGKAMVTHALKPVPRLEGQVPKNPSWSVFLLNGVADGCHELKLTELREHLLDVTAYTVGNDAGVVLLVDPHNSRVVKVDEDASAEGPRPGRTRASQH